jgi:hypothetical protein
MDLFSFFNGLIIQQRIVRAGFNTGGFKSHIKPFNAHVTFKCMFVLACKVRVGSAIRTPDNTTPAPYTTLFIKIDYTVIQSLYSAADTSVHAPRMLAMPAHY